MENSELITFLSQNYQFQNIELMNSVHMRTGGLKYLKAEFEGKPIFIKAGNILQGLFENEYKKSLKCYQLCPKHFLKPLSYKDFSDINFIAMEFCDGNTISKEIVCKDKDLFRNQFEEIANTLFTANIVHRDIRPDNFLVSDDGIIKVIDFQFAVDFENYNELVTPYTLYRLGSKFALSHLKWDDFYSLSKVLKFLDLNKTDVINQRIGKRVLVAKDRSYYLLRVNVAKFICMFLPSKKWKISIRNKLYKVRGNNA